MTGSWGMAAHVFFGTLAFGVSITLDVIVAAAARSRSLEAIRTVYAMAATFSRWVGSLFGLAILLGFFEAIKRGESLTAPWLIATYVLLLAGTVAGIVLSRRRIAEVLSAARETSVITPELERAIARTSPASAWIGVIVMGAIVTLMIVKP
jgi:hypothetical protein